MTRSAFDEREDHKTRQGGKDAPERLGRSPTPRLCLDEGEDQKHEPTRGGQGSAKVQRLIGAFTGGTRDETCRRHDRNDADREVDEEDPPPGELAREQASYDQANC